MATKKGVILPPFLIENTGKKSQNNDQRSSQQQWWLYSGISMTRVSECYIPCMRCREQYSNTAENLKCQTKNEYRYYNVFLFEKYVTKILAATQTMQYNSRPISLLLRLWKTLSVKI